MALYSHQNEPSGRIAVHFSGKALGRIEAGTSRLSLSQIEVHMRTLAVKQSFARALFDTCVY
jgi:hypothetical protein